MFEDFKPVLKILVRFILIYLALLGLYQLYLNSQEGLDGFSTLVAQQCTSVQNQMGYISKIVPQPEYKTTWYYMNGDYVSRMVEGCNAISVMILFAAFIFAFYQGAKTFVFVLVGLVALHIVNVLRIVGINIVAVEAPEYINYAHDYVFPAVIYGGVVLLWIIWIKFFVLKNEKVA
ncbi:exosortase family protein XrtF [Riemerella columbina]|uniref:exosortase family protein XrtF n=1 Tax=Riemerella columbina TaxID=103810 RepID=UPI0026708A9C|nr:exosortase family protein XrtF [Riemerella columbina]WKS95004.1 exosortase family protein XrtF [Riemerella columbina]